MACSYNGDKIYNLEPHKHEDWKWFSWKEIVEFNENNELFYDIRFIFRRPKLGVN